MEVIISTILQWLLSMAQLMHSYDHTSRATCSIISINLPIRVDYLSVDFRDWWYCVFKHT